MKACTRPTFCLLPLESSAIFLVGSKSNRSQSIFSLEGFCPRSVVKYSVTAAPVMLL